MGADGQPRGSGLEAAALHPRQKRGKQLIAVFLSRFSENIGGAALGGGFHPLRQRPIRPHHRVPVEEQISEDLPRKRRI